MSNWTIFSNHGHVLLCLARDPEARLRDVAADVGLTERAVQKIVRDLQQSGMIIVSKHGRRNRYRIDNKKSLRHELEAHCTLGALIDLIVNESFAKINRHATEPAEAKAVELSPEPALPPVAVPALKKPDESKAAKPSKTDSKTTIQRQQGSLF